MSQATLSYFPPVLREAHLDRLALVPPGLEFDREVWAEVHDEVQRMLEPLEGKVRSRFGNVLADSGQTQGKAFLLFTYRTFSVPGSGVEPVVAGMNFTRADNGIGIDADISGEQTGDTMLELPRTITQGSKQELLVAARELAQRLCEGDKQIVDALSDQSRSIE